nr:hypothetical protein [Chlamydiota bacterium]
MEIQASYASPATFSAYQNPVRGASETTWKTHALVVLSYFLIGIGIALACASVYLATVVHPMIAMATPIVPIVLGILLRPNTSSGLFFASKAPVYIKGQPLGISNRDSSTCWLNAALQVLNHASSYKELMQETAKNSDTITQQSVKKLLPFFGLFPLISAFKNYQAELDEESGRPLSSVSSATVRKWLS